MSNAYQVMVAEEPGENDLIMVSHHWITLKKCSICSALLEEDDVNWHEDHCSSVVKRENEY